MQSYGALHRMGAKILMISGEESGDIHGSSLMTALKEREPSIIFKGMGGKRMRGQGLVGLDSTRLSVVGIAEVFKKIPSILRAFFKLKRLVKGEYFDCAVLIDYPDFNLKFAGALKKLNVPVIYYISPQVWAWRKKRINKIARLVRKMLVIFPFEENLYRDAHVDVEYVGHPLAEKTRLELTKEEARGLLSIDKDVLTVAILPGSRTEEVGRLLGCMLKGVELVSANTGKDVEVLIAAAESIEDPVIEKFSRGMPFRPRIIRNGMYSALRASDAAIVASGTATLEAALIGVPMVIVYKVSIVSYLLGRVLVNMKHIGLPNIVLERPVVSELLQNDATPRNIAGELLKILSNPDGAKAMLKGYEEIREKLSLSKNAYGAAAEAVLKVMGDART